MKRLIILFLLVSAITVQAQTDTSVRHPFGFRPSARTTELNGNLKIMNTPPLSANGLEAVHAKWVRDYIAANGTISDALLDSMKGTGYTNRLPDAFKIATTTGGGSQYTLDERFTYTAANISTHLPSNVGATGWVNFTSVGVYNSAYTSGANGLASTSSSATDAGYYIASNAPAANDQESGMVVTDVSGYGRFIVKYIDAGNYLYVEPTSSSVTIKQVIGYATTTIATTATGYSSGDTVQIRTNGTAVYAKKNGTVLITNTFNNTTLNGTRVGFYSYNTTGFKFKAVYTKDLTISGSVTTYKWGANYDSLINKPNLYDSTLMSSSKRLKDSAAAIRAAIGTGGGITALTGDLAASGTGSVAATIAGHAVTFAKQQQIAGLSIPGVTGNSTADLAAITFGTDKFGLFREGNTLVAKKADSSNVTGLNSEPYYNTKFAPKTNIPLNTLSVSGATTNQIIQNNGTAWAPITPVIVTLTSPTDGQILEWDASGSQFINVDNNPTVAAPTIIERIVGTGAAPIEGDSTYVASECDGSQCKIHLDGLLLMSDSVNGAYVDTATGKITFGHYLHTGQKIIIETINYTAGTIGASLEDLTFPTQSGLTNTATVWTGSSTADYHNNYGLSGKKLAAGTDGYIESKYTASDATYGVMAFNTSNTNQRYTDNPGAPTVYYYEAGWVIIGGGVLSYLDNNAAQSSTGYTLSTGDYIRVIRTGSVLKLQTSPDHTAWTDRHTYTFSSTADLFININIDALIGVSKVYNPKGYNLQ